MMVRDNQHYFKIKQIVDHAQKAIKVARLTLGILIWLGVSLGGALGLFALDNLVHLPAGLRLALSIAALGVMIYLGFKRIFTPLWQKDNADKTAIYLEQKYAVPENLLINSLQFEGRTVATSSNDGFSGDKIQPGGQPFARYTIRSGLNLMKRTSLHDLWQFKRVSVWVVAVVVVVGLWLFYSVAHGHYALNALNRFVRPLADVPPIGSAIIRVTPGEDCAIAEGDDLTIEIEISHYKSDARSAAKKNLQTYPEILKREGEDYIEPIANKAKSIAALAHPGHPGRYRMTFKSVKRAFAFRVFAADTYSSSIHVSVNTAPRIQESQYHIDLPAYTGQPRISVMGPPESLTALKGSHVSVDVKLDKTAGTLLWKYSEKNRPFHLKNDHWRAEFKVEKAEAYQVEVHDNDIDRDIIIAEGSIALQADRVPEVNFAQTAYNRTVYPQQRLRLEVESADDFGLKEINLTLQIARDASKEKRIKQWHYKGPPGKKGTVREVLLLTISEPDFRPGESYILQAYSKDFSPAGHVGKSQPLILQVRSLDELTMDQDNPQSAAFAALDQAIKAQQAALGVTQNVITQLDDILDAKKSNKEKFDSVNQHRSQMSNMQGQVGYYLGQGWNVAKTPKPAFAMKMKAIRDGEHTRVMTRIAEMVREKITEKQAVQRVLGPIEDRQEFILSQLIALKGQVARKSELDAQKVAAELLGENDEMISESPEEALQTFVEELDDYIDKQKALLRQRSMLMDKTPEDFTDQQEDPLEKLSLDESKLAEILARAVNDLTNQNLLDFGDNAMVDSMTTIYDDAENLADKAREAIDARVDAYRLETEVVELAEELLINCEATLGFTDKIQFIAEIPEDEQLVAPLAELPSELEDLVGDLVTSEEEMAEELEDIGSYLNSLDHTAGPVADGTISSTSAKGKTGDQKPEDNVIQGRSGAGRSGMSDGQLVESVAKDLEDNDYGLRERTSNTPLESGMVKDEDAGAQTGGTGLGKTSDQSSLFGMGGKLPPKVLEMMRASQTRQQAIRQTAQQMLPKLKRHNLSVTQLQQSIGAMGDVEQALQKRDGVAIRQAYNQAVGTLKKSRQVIGNQVAIHYMSQKTATQRRANLQNSPGNRGFKGYEQMINAYFETLAEGE